MLLTDGNSNKTFLSVDLYGDLESALTVNQEEEEAGDLKK